MKKQDRAGLRTWIEVDKKKLAHNYRQFKNLIGRKTKLCAVVKSNAYGHGLVDFSKEIARLGADFLAVDSIVEGVRLRKEGITKPILVLGYTLPERLDDAIEYDISVSVSHKEAAMEVAAMGKPVKVHVKVDTGMHRQGFFLKDAPALLSFLKKHPNIVIEGLFTHFADAKNPAFPKTTQMQIDEFTKWRDIFTESGFKPIAHAAATSGTLLFPQSHFDMVRIGIGMYGLWPSSDVMCARKREVNLEPILSWKTIISEAKTLPKGSKIGYDLTERLRDTSTIAICPVGYWHGYDRKLSSIGEVTVSGKRMKVLGRVAMDMITIDVGSKSKISIGDEVTIWGGKGLTVDEVASLANTTNYEMTTRLNPLIKKFYI